MRTGYISTLVCALLAGYGGTAAAQTEDFFDLSPNDLSKLKVTAASAFTESALDSSATVSVVKREDWERRGARNLPDAVMHAPGVMLLQPPSGGKLIQVRSYDSSSLRGRATLIDGVPINTFAFGSEVFSNAELQLPVLDSLELVRGPSSILYGSDAFHSALLLSTYRSDAPEFLLSGEAGSNDYQQAALRASQPLGDNQSLQTAISATHQGDQHARYDYRTVAGTIAETERAQNYDAASALLRWSGKVDKINHALELFIDKTDANEFPGAGSAGGDTRNFDVAKHNAELWLLKGQLDGDLTAGWDWRWDAYYWRNDYGQSYLLPANAAATIFFEDEQQYLEHRNGTSFRVTQSDWQALGGKTQLALTAGYEQAAIDDHDYRRARLDGGPIGQPALDYSGLDQSIGSLSVEGKTRWADGRWQLIYGGRIDDYSTFGGQTSPRLGLIWIPATDYSFKALYGGAFRAPNANELLGTSTVSGDNDLKPETLDNYELAFAMVRGRWRLELVGFESKWHDRIILSSDPSALNQLRYANVGESESKGAELSATYINDRWRLEFSGSSIANRNLDTDMKSTIFPEWIVNVGAGYRWPTQKIELFVNNRWHQDVKVGDPGLTTQQFDNAGVFFRTDITLKQQWTAEWSGRLAVRNAFDRENIWPAVVNNRGGVIDIERQVAFELEYRPHN
ncbi:MAG: TonB-dependent receptor [Spongiibacteraceae bacterium]